jgi:hypothetical protein
MKTIFFIAAICLCFGTNAQQKKASLDTTKVTINPDSAQKTITITLDGPKTPTSPALHILDGKEISVKEVHQLNPEHIQSVTVLKSQDAIARYGEKGKNGVVIIQRKKGRFQVE